MVQINPELSTGLPALDRILKGLMPGDNIFSDLVEMDILYVAFFPDRQANQWDRAFFERTPNRLGELLPGTDDLAEIVHVIDPSDRPDVRAVHLYANVLDQTAIVYSQPES